MCKVLNRQLLEGIDKPIMEFIIEYLIKRIVLVQHVVSKNYGLLTPNATRIFNVILKEAAEYIVTWNGGELYSMWCMGRPVCGKHELEKLHMQEVGADRHASQTCNDLYLEYSKQLVGTRHTRVLGE